MDGINWRLCNIILLFSLIALVHGETQYVSVQQLTFQPNFLQINQGDTVIWEWESTAHNVAETDTSSSTIRKIGGFYSGESSSPGYFEHTFLETGTFYYICEEHIASNMRGTINVVMPPGSTTGEEEEPYTLVPSLNFEPDIFEEFDSVSNMMARAVDHLIFDGGATIQDPSGFIFNSSNPYLLATGFYANLPGASLAEMGNAFSHVEESGRTTITFSQPIKSFGGYFGYAEGSNLKITFRDVNTVLLGEFNVDYDATASNGTLAPTAFVGSSRKISIVQIEGGYYVFDYLVAETGTAIPPIYSCAQTEYTSTEGFEVFEISDFIGAFNGTATMWDGFGFTWSEGAYPFSGTNLNPSEGLKAFGHGFNDSQALSISFSVPVLHFGGRFGYAEEGGSLSVSFYGVQNNYMGRMELDFDATSSNGILGSFTFCANESSIRSVYISGSYFVLDSLFVKADPFYQPVNECPIMNIPQTADETFNYIAANTPISGSIPIFNNNGYLDDNKGLIFASGSLSFSAGVPLMIDGNGYYHNDTAASTVTLMFQSPIRSFGGNFGYEEGKSPIEFRFFDSNGEVVATETLTYDAVQMDGILLTKAFCADYPIVRIDITGSNFAMDSLVIEGQYQPPSLVYECPAFNGNLNEDFESFSMQTQPPIFGVFGSQLLYDPQGQIFVGGDVSMGWSEFYATPIGQQGFYHSASEEATTFFNFNGKVNGFGGYFATDGNSSLVFTFFGENNNFLGTKTFQYNIIGAQGALKPVYYCSPEPFVQMSISVELNGIFFFDQLTINYIGVSSTTGDNVPESVYTCEGAPFDVTEGFESFEEDSSANAAGIFLNEAIMFDTSAFIRTSYKLIDAAETEDDEDVFAYPSGTQFFVHEADGNWVDISFSNEIKSFGGLFATRPGDNNITFVFSDSNNYIIGEQVVTYTKPYGVLQRFGFCTTGRIKGVQIVGSHFVLDNLEIQEINAGSTGSTTGPYNPMYSCGFLPSHTETYENLNLFQSFAAGVNVITGMVVQIDSSGFAQNEQTAHLGDSIYAKPHGNQLFGHNFTGGSTSFHQVNAYKFGGFFASEGPELTLVFYDNQFKQIASFTLYYTAAQQNGDLQWAGYCSSVMISSVVINSTKRFYFDDISVETQSSSTLSTGSAGSTTGYQNNINTCVSTPTATENYESFDLHQNFTAGVLILNSNGIQFDKYGSIQIGLEAHLGGTYYARPRGQQLFGHNRTEPETMTIYSVPTNSFSGYFASEISPLTFAFYDGGDLIGSYDFYYDLNTQQGELVYLSLCSPNEFDVIDIKSQSRFYMDDIGIKPGQQIDFTCDSPPVSDFSESFESFSVGTVPISTSILSGSGTLYEYYEGIIFETPTNVFDLGNSINAIAMGSKAFAHNMELFSITITFNQPIRSFSGYFAYRSGYNPLQFQFYNSQLIGSDYFSYDSLAYDGELKFAQFCFDEPVNQINIVGSYFVVDQLSIQLYNGLTTDNDQPPMFTTGTASVSTTSQAQQGSTTSQASVSTTGTAQTSTTGQQQDPTRPCSMMNPTMIEGYESFAFYENFGSPKPIFGGFATQIDNYGDIYGDDGLLAPGVYAVPRGAKLFGHEDQGSTIITFNNSVVSFGGFFASSQSPLFFDFFDENGADIGYKPLIYNGNNGALIEAYFCSDVPFKKVQVSTGAGYFYMDDIAYKAVGQPAVTTAVPSASTTKQTPVETTTSSVSMTTSQAQQQGSTTSQAQQGSTSSALTTASVQQGSTTSQAQQASTTSQAQQASTTSQAQQGSTTSQGQQASTTSQAQQGSTSSALTTASVQQGSTTSQGQQASTTSQAQASTTSQAQQGSTTSQAQQGSTTSQAQQGSTTSQGQQASTTSQGQQGSTTSQAQQASTTSQAQQASTTSQGQQGSTTSQAQQGSTSSALTTASVQQGSTTSQGQQASTTSQAQQGSTTSQVQQGSTTSPEAASMTTSQNEPVMTTSQVQQEMTTSKPDADVTSGAPREITSSRLTTSSLPSAVSTSRLTTSRSLTTQSLVLTVPAIKIEIRLNSNYSAVSNWVQWELEFIQTLARLLNQLASRFRILSRRPGSIIVDFIVEEPEESSANQLSADEIVGDFTELYNQGNLTINGASVLELTNNGEYTGTVTTATDMEFEPKKKSNKAGVIAAAIIVPLAVIAIAAIVVIVIIKSRKNNGGYDHNQLEMQSKSHKGSSTSTNTKSIPTKQSETTPTTTQNNKNDSGSDSGSDSDSKSQSSKSQSSKSSKSKSSAAHSRSSSSSAESSSSSESD